MACLVDRRLVPQAALAHAVVRAVVRLAVSHVVVVVVRPVHVVVVRVVVLVMAVHRGHTVGPVARRVVTVAVVARHPVVPGAMRGPPVPVVPDAPVSVPDHPVVTVTDGQRAPEAPDVGVSNVVAAHPVVAGAVARTPVAADPVAAVADVSTDPMVVGAAR